MSYERITCTDVGSRTHVMGTRLVEYSFGDGDDDHESTSSWWQKTITHVGSRQYIIIILAKLYIQYIAARPHL